MNFSNLIKKLIAATLIAAFSNLVIISDLSFTGLQLDTAFAESPPYTNFGRAIGTATPERKTQDFQVDLFTGSGTSSYSIEVPAGRRGMSPKIDLTYSSNRGNGWLGVGWGMEMGYLERVANNQAFLDYGPSGKFALVLNSVNSKLVNIGSNQFRLKNETGFNKVESNGSSWTATDKNGTRFFFGSNSSSRMTNQNGIYRWNLDKVVDVNGNSMSFNFVTDGGQTYLNQIQYTGNENEGDLPSYTVDFILESRPDVSSSYQSLAKVTIAKRLKEILVKYNGELIKRYAFQYTLSPDTFRSLLTSISVFGTDNTTSLPPIQYQYNQNVNRSSSIVTWGSLPTTGDYPANYGIKYLTSGDFDGLGYPDVAVVYAGVKQHFDPCCPGQPIFVLYTQIRVATTNGISFTDRGVWQTATIWNGIGQSYPIPNSIFSLDINDDGYDDIMRHYSQMYSIEPWFKSLNLNGGGLEPPPTQASQALFSNFGFNGTYDFTMKMNQDYLPDIGYYLNGFTLKRSNGSSYDTITGPSELTTGKPVVGDFNGDGFDDIATNTNGTWKVALSNGNTFSYDGTWLTGFGTSSSDIQVSGDFNNDGLVDVAYVTSSGTWHMAVSDGGKFNVTHDFTTNLVAPADFFSGVRVFGGDVNGDGLSDLGQINTGSGSINVALADGGSPSDLLTKITNEKGGESQIEYQVIKPTPNLKFPVQTIKTVTERDGLGNSYITNYNYIDGLYNKPEREFRGFRQTTMTDAAGAKTIYTFAQDSIQKGKILSKESKDSAGNLFEREVDVYENIQPYGAGYDSYFVRLASVNISYYDGDSTYKETRQRFEYDNYGNVITIYEDGDVDTSTDDRKTINEYTYNTNAHILNTIQSKKVYNYQNLKIAEKKLYYDGSQNLNDPPAKGLVTKTEDIPQQGPVLTTQMEYDNYGNIRETVDSRGVLTQNSYDITLKSNLIMTTNVYGQQKQFTYDPKFSQITDSIDLNGQTTRTLYDELGRVRKVISPLDSEEFPTQEIQYDTSVVPNRIITKVKSSASSDPNPQYLTTFTFVDGLGRVIQKRSPAEAPNQQIITSVVEFDARGNLKHEYVPYFESFSTNYQPVNQNNPKITYDYDPMGRIIKTTYPDLTFSRIIYDDFVRTEIDRNNHQKRISQDAFGNIVEVQEFNGAEIYTTQYEYDAQSRLTKTIDHYGHETIIIYDTLGRKRSVNDPNTGFWQYEYDSNDNLTAQIDARGSRIEFTYDPLNRITKKTFPDGNHVDYVYDSCPSDTCGGLPGTNYSIGKLVKVADNSGIQVFRYDPLGRVIQDKKSLDDGNDYVFTRVYDALDRVSSLEYPDGDVLNITYNGMGETEIMALIRTDQTQMSIISNVDYNPSGQVIKIQYGNGVTTDYTYNPQSLRLTHLLTRGGQNQLLQDFGYSFDNEGNVLSIQDSINTNSQSFQYDDLDRLIQASNPQGYGIHDFQYNAIGNMTQKNNATLQYNDPLHPQAVTQYVDSSETITFSYDANGNMIQRNNELLTYDFENQLVQLTRGASSEPQDHTFQFNPGWNTFTLPFQPFNTTSGQYMSDIQEIFSGLNIGPDYDQISYWDSTAQAWDHFVIDPEFTDITTLETGKTYKIYVTNSQSISATIQSNPADNQPILIGSYVYDTTGQRVKKSADNQITYYLGKDYEVQYGPNNLLTRKGFYLGEVRVSDLEISSQGIPHLRFYHQDHLSSTNVVSNEAGMQTLLMEYLPYGEVKRREGTDIVNRTYTGHEEDLESDLIYAGARYYDPQIGRFITPDSFIQSPEDPQSFNRYAYARNNPIRFVDPSGNFWWIIVAIIAAVVKLAITIATTAITIIQMAGTVILQTLQAAAGALSTGAGNITISEAVLAGGDVYVEASSALLTTASGSAFTISEAVGIASASAALAATQISAATMTSASLTNEIHFSESIDRFIDKQAIADKLVDNIKLPGEGSGLPGGPPTAGNYPVVTDGMIALTISAAKVASAPDILLREAKTSRSSPKKQFQKRSSREKPGANQKVKQKAIKSMDRFRPRPANEPTRQIRMEQFKTKIGRFLEGIAKLVNQGSEFSRDYIDHDPTNNY